MDPESLARVTAIRHERADPSMFNTPFFDYLLYLLRKFFHRNYSNKTNHVGRFSMMTIRRLFLNKGRDLFPRPSD